MRRPAGAALVAVAGLLLAGCTGGSDGDASSSPSTPAPSSSTVPASSSPATGTETAGASPTAGTSTAATPTAAGTQSPPPAPTVPSSYQGAYTLTGGGGSVTGYLTSVACAQDGSVTADQLTLAPGASSVTLTVQPSPLGPITIAGSADLDAAGGTFRGADADRAITVVWTC